jgi:hypothetical protein
VWPTDRPVPRTRVLTRRFVRTHPPSPPSPPRRSLGKNEKTKVIAKLQRKAAGAPSREPAVNDEERKAMMAWYFKKQEEEKAMAADNEDAYLGASWADPKALKRDLMGAGSIAWRPGGGGAGR